MQRYYLLGWFFLLLIVPVANGAKISLTVEGLSGQLAKNVQIKLSSIKKDEVVPDSRLIILLDQAIRLGLRPLGYYEPTIEFSYHELNHTSRLLLILTVYPGKPVHLADIKITLHSAAQYDLDYQKMIRRNIPPKGMIINHNYYEHFKKKFSQLAIRKGYFDADMKTSKLSVSLVKKESYWQFDFNSGERYRLGPIKYEGALISEEYLNNIVPFKYGEYFTSDKLAEFNRRLVDTGWFNSAMVIPDINQARQNGQHILPIYAVLTPRVPNHVELGGGYSTHVGPRVKVIWNKPWINSLGHSWTSSIHLSQPENMINVSYKIPIKQSPLEQYYTIQAGYQRRTDVNSRQSESDTTLHLLRNWDYSQGWQYGVDMRWSISHFSQANVMNTTMLLYPGMRISRILKQGGAISSWGDSQRYTIDISNTTWGSAINFMILQAHHIWIRTPWKGHRFVVRSHFGWIKTDQFSHLPPDLRFFAGGDRSIRGYSDKNSSPNSQGQLTGASKLAVGSLEYQYTLADHWWLAIFVDGGEAVHNLNQPNLKFGAGVGVRWSSPIGPIKLDIAAPISDPDYRQVKLYIGLGPEL